MGAAGVRGVADVRQRSPAAAATGAAVALGQRARAPRSLRADSASTCSGRSGPASAPAAGAAAPPRGSTCALVPLKPNELTPAMRGGSPAATARARVGDCDRQRRRARCAGSSALKCRCGGIAPCCSASTTLISAGDAGGRLEVADVGLDRADQQRTVRRAAGAEHGRRAPATSIGSPSGVPVPCAST